MRMKGCKAIEHRSRYRSSSSNAVRTNIAVKQHGNHQQYAMRNHIIKLKLRGCSDYSTSLKLQDTKEILKCRIRSLRTARRNFEETQSLDQLCTHKTLKIFLFTLRSVPIRPGGAKEHTRSFKRPAFVSSNEDSEFSSDKFSHVHASPSRY